MAKDSTDLQARLLAAVRKLPDSKARDWLQRLLEHGETFSSEDLGRKPPRDKNGPTTPSQPKE